ncbi:hypothetical protein EVAR_63579_1 [Eumeta japonica]|uniref:Uncharacterized protein n=1 Tax=Eumeta variegata TaxID=151549 RepID=A0A4C1ZN61_EUMVA|nr:hypothetical protein EVAR_63579_1 [Eumeta japonica]
MSVYPLTTPLDLRPSREIFKFGPLKWGHLHWTVGVVSPTRRRPGMRQVLRPAPAPANKLWSSSKGIAILAGQMASRRKRDEDGSPIDRPTAYYGTEAETPGTGGRIANQGAIPRRTD